MENISTLKCVYSIYSNYELVKIVLVNINEYIELPGYISEALTNEHILH